MRGGGRWGGRLVWGRGESPLGSVACVSVCDGMAHGYGLRVKVASLISPVLSGERRRIAGAG